MTLQITVPQAPHIHVYVISAPEFISLHGVTKSF